MSEKPQAPLTLADYIVGALSPALIMALVGSLVFFLLEVLYVGAYSSQLQWGLFFFVFAAVLIARISMRRDLSSRAPLYGGILGLLVWLTLQQYVEYPRDSPVLELRWAINLGLIALTWWCAHRLTWDCTHLDENEEAASAGILEASGLEQSTGGDPEPAPPEEEEPEAKPLTWWQRYQHYRAERKNRHTPGVWVVYFSLAALPLFGLGQSLIPVDQEGRRRYVFWLLTLYVGSGLGLLLTTCFLGLRRYLRQRQVKMPAALAGVWLTAGGVTIVLLLLVGALLPRPNAENPLVDIPGVGSGDRNASRWAMKGGSPGKGEGSRLGERRPGDKGGQQDNSKDGRGGNGEKGGDKAGKTDSKGGQGAKDKGEGGSRSGGQDKGSGKQDGDKGSSGGDKGSSGGDKGSSGGEKSGKNQSGERRDQEDRQPGGTGARTKPQDQQGQKPQSGAQDKDQQQQQADEQSQQQPQSSGSLWQSLQSFFAGLLPWLKWIVFIVFVLLVGFMLLRALLQFLANFSNWAAGLLKALQDLWQALFGWWQPRPAAAGGPGEARSAGGPPPRPFSSYSNPFADGRARGLSPEELVRYSFEALQAWAWERDFGRRPDETPLEFVARLGDEVPALEADAVRLANLYVRALYARGPLPANCRASVQQFWEALEAAAGLTVSA
jgi:hypothetical protein